MLQGVFEMNTPLGENGVLREVLLNEPPVSSVHGMFWCVTVASSWCACMSFRASVWVGNVLHWPICAFRNPF